MKFLLGADPELFLSNGKTFVSAHGLIPGTKEKPFAVEKGAIQVDGMAAEFNIDPCETPQDFSEGIETVMKGLQAHVPDLILSPIPVARFSKAYMNKQPREALELGCDPDYDAWAKGKANPRPNGNVTFRTGGGHIHVGWTKDMDTNDPDHKEACMTLVRELDIRLGLLSLFWDKEDGRREMYGKAGAFRIKPYGVEYRSLSNSWVRNKDLQQLVAQITLETAQDLVEGNALQRRVAGMHIRRAINTSDRDLAVQIMRHYHFGEADKQKLKDLGVHV